MAVSTAVGVEPRQPRARDFVRLKLRLLRNGFRGQPLRVVAFVLGLGGGLIFGGLAALGLAFSAAGSRDLSFVVASFAGAALVLAWTLVPLLFFGVDETLDPARFALLPVRRMTLARGMLAAALVGVPPVISLLATAGLAIAAAKRFHWVAGLVALFGVIAGLVLGVVASRAVTSAFAALLRSRRVRDLAAVLIALLASSVGPMQWAITAAIGQGNITEALRIADIVAWTPLGAPYVLGFDVAEGRPGIAAARLAITLATIALLLLWWSRTIESAMLGAASGSGPKARTTTSGKVTGAVASLISAPLRRIAGAGVFGAIVAREARYWWRDPRRRAGLLSIMIASAVVPIALNLAAHEGDTSVMRGPGSGGLTSGGLTFSVTLAGVMGGMLLANQFAYDGSAYAAHLLAQVPGRVELRARAAAIAIMAVPVQLLVVLLVTVLADDFTRLPAGIGLLASGFGASIAGAALLSVLAPYALPENTNPFAVNTGSGSAKSMLAIVALLVTSIITAPVVVGALLLSDSAAGQYAVLAVGVGYGVALAWAGTLAAGAIVDRRGPELLKAITPKR